MHDFVLDNGAGCIKCGNASDKSPTIIPNCVMKAKSVKNRTFIGSQIDDCKDLSGLYYLLPFQRGFLSNWDYGRQVWDYIFDVNRFKTDFDQTRLIITEPQFNFASIQEVMNEIIFEEYQFASAFRTTAPDLSCYKYMKDFPSAKCAMVVDAGFSFTHVIPFHHENKLKSTIKRIDVGGKALTNHLKETLSYRQLNVMDETFVINQCKEDVCFVTQDFDADHSIAKAKGAQNTISRNYVLPDYTHVNRGYIATEDKKASPHQQVLVLNNERFLVPEVLFYPSNINIPQMGVGEALIESVSLTPEPMRPHLYNNVVVIGGTARLPGFSQRLQAEVQKGVPCEYTVKTYAPEDPLTYAWYGGQALTADPEKLQSLSVTKKEYEEHGHTACSKFTL